MLSWAAAGDVAVTALSFTLQRNYEVLALCLEQLQMVRKGSSQKVCFSDRPGCVYMKTLPPCFIPLHGSPSPPSPSERANCGDGHGI